LVSIGLPVYNGGDFLADALNSLLAQSFHSFELIISDNCSSDDTLEICKKYALLDQRVRWISQSENIGPIGNFRFLLEQASCPFFMWAAADDVWSSNYLGESISKLQLDPGASFAVAPYKCCSMASPVFSRRTTSCLEVLSIESDIERLKAFASLPLSLHKDNLVYAVYRTNFLKDCVQNSSIQIFGEPLIGGPLNDLVVFKGRGVFVSAAKFYKRYKLFPPRGAFDYLFTAFKALPVRLLRKLFPRQYHLEASSVEVTRSYAEKLRKVYMYAQLNDLEASELIHCYFLDAQFP